MSSKRIAVPVVVFACVVAIAAYWMRNSTPGPAAEPPGDGAGLATANRAVPAGAPPSRTEATEQVTVLRVVGGAAQVPLAEAFVCVLPEDGADTLQRDVLASAAADGTISLTATPAVQLLACCSGYVPRIVASDALPELVVLDEATVLSVSVLDDRGVGLEDALVMLARDSGPGNPMSGLDLPEPGIGHPLSALPVWAAPSGGDGRVEFSELPPARYALYVHHDTMVPASDMGDGSTLALAPGRHSVHVPMQPWHAVVFRCPSDAAVTNVLWSVPVVGLNRSHPVLSRLHRIHGWLTPRYPDCHVYAHVPGLLGGELPVRCFVETADGSRYRGEWELTPVRDLEQPVFLELDTTPRRPVTIRLVGPDGEDYPGVPFAATPVGRGHSDRHDGVTGEPVLMPCGTFRLEPRQLSRPIIGAFQDFEITVTMDGLGEFVARSAERMVEVVVRPRLPPGPVLSPLGIYFYNERGHGPAVVNWKPPRGPVRCLLAGSRVSVQIRSVGYEDVDLPARDTRPGEPLEFDVELRARER